jgi:DNA-binding transcriptional MerR regulator
MNAFAEPFESRRAIKSAAAFRTISEVATDLDVPQHVLRFWETKFTQVRPLKRGGGRRYYRPEDVDLLRRIRKLLYSDGYTIKGVQKLLREGNGRLHVAAPVPAPASAAPVIGEAAPKPAVAEIVKAAPAPAADKRRAELEAILGELEATRALLRDG